MSIEGSATQIAPSYSRSLNVVVFGRRCTLTAIPLKRLVESRLSVRALILPTTRSFGPTVRMVASKFTIPLMSNSESGSFDSVDTVAARNNVPVAMVHRPLSDELADLIEDLAVDLIVVSCFPWRIPLSVCRHAKLGAINLHPSPLPRFRGPDPLFWAFQTATKQWGVTVHRVTQQLDAGPILDRRSIQIPDAVSGAALERLCAETGSLALRNVVNQISWNSAQEVMQDESVATYFGFPEKQDLCIAPSWNVSRALNFVSGVPSLGYSPLIVTSRGIVQVQSATAIDEQRRESAEHWIRSDLVRLRLLDGWVEFSVIGVEN